MTALATAPTTGQASKYRRNTFEHSLDIGWQLSAAEIEKVAKEFRTVSIALTESITFSGKVITPKRPEGMTDEERAQQKRDIDEMNAERVRKVYDFLARFFTPETATLLTRKVKSHITGVVLLHCPGDEHFTLIAEHDGYVPDVA